MPLDQAEELRRLAREARPRSAAARVLAVTSGKGGVGKTNLSVNLALALAALGRKVIVLDMDLGLANVDLLVDVAPRHNLSHVLAGEVDLLDAVVQAPGGIGILPGASGIDRIANLGDAERRELLQSFERLQRRADFLIVDTGAGIGRNVTGFAACADEVLIVTTPEPTSLVDAYASIKMISQDRDAGNLRLVVNMAQHRQEAERVANGIVGVARRFLNVYVERLGYVLLDPAVPKSVRRKRPFLLEAPDSPASHCVRTLASLLIRPPGGGAGPARPSQGFLQRLFHRLWGGAPAAAAAGRPGA